MLCQIKCTYLTQQVPLCKPGLHLKMPQQIKYITVTAMQTFQKYLTNSFPQV